MTATDLTDTSHWLPLDGLAPGFDANKAPHSRDLAGREVVVDESGRRAVYTFAEHKVSWAVADGSPSGTDAYEAFLVDTGLYFVQMHHTSNRSEALSLVLDLSSGRSLSIVTAIGEPSVGVVEPGSTRVKQSFTSGLIDGIPTTGAAAVPTTALIGRRVYWTYSPVHAYEHVYLSPQWYTWQCLAGPEKGLADTDLNTTWQVRPGINVFAWREKVIPCAAVTIADHRNTRDIRSHGMLFGLDETDEVPTHFTFGAYGYLLSNTVHPELR